MLGTANVTVKFAFVAASTVSAVVGDIEVTQLVVRSSTVREMFCVFVLFTFLTVIFVELLPPWIIKTVAGLTTSRYFGAAPAAVVVEVDVLDPLLLVLDELELVLPLTATETVKLLNHRLDGEGVSVPLHALAPALPVILNVSRQLELWAAISKLVKLASLVTVLQPDDALSAVTE